MIHSKFITTSIAEILFDAANATCCAQQGINIQPLSDYIMQSVFIKLTGAQEQKIKCICWELATVDFDTRRELYTNWQHGECSHIKDKNAVLNILINNIIKRKPDFDADNAIDRTFVLNNAKAILAKFFESANIKGFSGKEYNDFLTIFGAIEPECIYYSQETKGGRKRSFFTNCDNCIHKKDINKIYTCSNKKNLGFMYECMYNHRNRCAHNLTSYQQNLPALTTLRNVDYVYENYFIRFLLLLIIDIIIVKLYDTFLEEIKKLETIFV